MPRFDGTGPQGKGPMTGRGMGFCVLKEFTDKPGNFHGLAGIQGKVVNNFNRDQIVVKEANDMSFGEESGPAEMGPMMGKAAGYCTGYGVPGYRNPFGARVGHPIQPPAGFYSPWPVVRYGRKVGRGFGWAFGRGRGRGWGRGRFGFRW